MKLDLTEQEINQILNTLGEKPFAQVHNLIAKIMQQGNAELKESQVNGKTD